MTYPTLSVELALGDDPLDTTPTWTDITAYVHRITTAVGRDTELDEYPGGTAELVLDNSDRRFDPLYASGPYYGDLRSGVRVRIRATHSAVTYTLFVGWVDGFPQDYADDTGELTVRCSDAFRLLAGMALPASVYDAVVDADAPWARYRLKERNGSTWADASGNERDATVRFPSSLAQLNIDDAGMLPYVPDDVVIASDGSPFFDAEVTPPDRGVLAPYTIAVWWRGIDADTVDNYGGSLLYDLDSGLTLEVGDHSDDTYKYRLRATWPGGQARTDSDVVNDGAAHYLAVRVDGSGTVRLYVDGVWITSTTTGGPAPLPSRPRWILGPQITASTGLEFVRPWWQLGEIAFWDRLLSAAELLEHYTAATAPWDGDTTGARIDSVLDWVGWPAALADTDTGLSELGPARFDRDRFALDYLRRVAATEQGHLWCEPSNSGKLTYRDRHHRLTATRSTTVQYVFTDEAGAGHHYETLDLTYREQDVVNDVEVTYDGGDVTVTDAASVTAYGRNSIRRDTELRTRNEAQSLGSWIVARYRNPIARCRAIELNPAAVASLFPAVLDVRVHDRVTARKLPQGVGSAIELDLIVEGVEHTIDNGQNVWTTTVRTSQADAGPWFLPDVAAPDDETLPAW